MVFLRTSKKKTTGSFHECHHTILEAISWLQIMLKIRKVLEKGWESYGIFCIWRWSESGLLFASDIQYMIYIYIVHYIFNVLSFLICVILQVELSSLTAESQSYQEQVSVPFKGKEEQKLLVNRKGKQVEKTKI